jgi:hypothetical protein
MEKIFYNRATVYHPDLEVNTYYEGDQYFSIDFVRLNDNLIEREVLIYQTINILDNLERFIGGIRFIGSNERTPEFEKNMIEIFDIKDFYPKITDVLSFEIIAERFEKNFYEINFRLGPDPDVLNSMVRNEVFKGSKFNLLEIRKELLFDSGFANPSKKLSKFLKSDEYKKFVKNLNDNDKLNFAIYRISNIIRENTDILLFRKNYWIGRGEKDHDGYLGIGFNDIDNIIVEIWDNYEKKITDLQNDDSLSDDEREKILDDEFVTIETGVMRLVNKWKDNVKYLKSKFDFFKNFHKKIELYAWANIHSIIKNEHSWESRLHLLIEKKFLKIEESYTDSNLYLDFNKYNDQMHKVFGLNNQTRSYVLNNLAEGFNAFIAKLDRDITSEEQYKIDQVLEGKDITKAQELLSSLTIDNEGKKSEYQLLLDYHKRMDKRMEDKILSINKTVKDIKKETSLIKDIKDDTTVIKEMLGKMMNQIKEIKSLAKGNNESIEKSINKIFKIVEENSNINDIVITNYIPRIKRWFDFWDLLEKDSKLFMPRSEYLYDSIESSDFDDYSPFVLYYSRVLEVELFQKIFKKFGISIREKYDDVSSLFEYDENISKKTKEDIDSGMINSFKNKLQKNDSKYNLGDMRLILDLLPDSKNPNGSKRYQAINALKELNIFINDEIGGIPKELITKIQKLISEYRNPSAHVGIINKKEAKTFFENYKNLMNELIGLFNKIN